MLSGSALKFPARIPRSFVAFPLIIPCRLCYVLPVVLLKAIELVSCPFQCS